MATSSRVRRWAGPGDRAEDLLAQQLPVQVVPLRQLLGMSVASCRDDRGA
jgi:hypothetical protein